MKCFLVFLLFIPNLGIAQYIINGDFEGLQGTSPNEDAKLEMLIWWKERQSISDLGVLIHSPDLFETPTYVPLALNYSVTSAKSGERFIGMHDYEMVYQQVIGLEEFQTYTISMDIQLMDSRYFNSNSNNLLSSYDFSLSGEAIRVYFCKVEPKYQSENDDVVKCSGDYINFKHGDQYDYFHVATFPINLSIFPPQTGWHHLSAFFVAPDSNYDWLIIELNNLSGTGTNSSCESGYLLIDDVSITCGCEVSCSNLDGCVEPTFYGNIINQNSFFRVSNLSNVSEATLKITSILGQTVVTNYTSTVICDNGVLGDLVWTGVNNNGADLASATYYAELTVTNLCGTQVITAPQSIVKVDNYDFAANPVYNYSCNPLLPEIPEPCCPSIVDFFIDNATISGPDYLEWKINHNLNVATLPGSIVTLEANADVLFQAGNQVNIGPGMTPLPGANYQIKIEPCPQLKLGFQHEETIFSENGNVNEPIERKDSIEEIEVFPNPTQSAATFKGFFPEEVTGKWELFDPAGQRVHSGRVEQGSKEITFPVFIKNSVQGVYFLKTQFSDGKGKDYFHVNKVVIIQ